MTQFSDRSLDDVKEYWNRRPCNIRHSTQPIGTREYFDEVEARKYFVEPHIPAFADFPRWTGKKVLEVGCGIGTDAINFARHGALYTGIELSESSLDLAKQRFEVFGLPGRLLQGDAESLESVLNLDQRFDLIYSFGVLHHTPDPLKAFTSIRHFCHETTELRVMLYAENSWKSSMIKSGLDQPEAQSGCPIAFTYTNDEVNLLFNEAGFKVKSLEQEHIFPYVVESYIHYRYEVEPWFAAMPRDMFRRLEKQLGWHLLIVGTPC